MSDNKPRSPRRASELATGPNSPANATNPVASETMDPFRETIEVAVGPNVDGHDHMARAAHALPPDPEIVDDPEAPELSAPTPKPEA